MNSFYTTTGEHIVKSTNHHDYHDDLEFCLNLENKKINLYSALVKYAKVLTF